MTGCESMDLSRDMVGVYCMARHGQKADLHRLAKHLVAVRLTIRSTTDQTQENCVIRRLDKKEPGGYVGSSVTQQHEVQ
jgi:hypothetical protein